MVFNFFIYVYFNLVGTWSNGTIYHDTRGNEDLRTRISLNRLAWF